MAAAAEPPAPRRLTLKYKPFLDASPLRSRNITEVEVGNIVKDLQEAIAEMLKALRDAETEVGVPSLGEYRNLVFAIKTFSLKFIVPGSQHAVTPTVSIHTTIT